MYSVRSDNRHATLSGGILAQISYEQFLPEKTCNDPTTTMERIGISLSVISALFVGFNLIVFVELIIVVVVELFLIIEFIVFLFLFERERGRGRG